MAFVIPNTTEREYLEDLLPEIYVRLYQNDHTPTENDDTGDYVQANFVGYAAKNPVFPGPASTVSDKAELTSIDIVWQKTASSGSNTIYGYYLTNFAPNVLYGAEKFASPITMNDVGDTVAFAIKATLESVG
jgi:hypothetical protein